MNRRYQRLSLSRVSPFKSKQFKSTQLNSTRINSLQKFYYSALNFKHFLLLMRVFGASSGNFLDPQGLMHGSPAYRRPKKLTLIRKITPILQTIHGLEKSDKKKNIFSMFPLNCAWWQIEPGFWVNSSRSFQSVSWTFCRFDKYWVKTWLGFEFLSTRTKHPGLKNEAPLSRKRSILYSRMKD